MLQQIISARIWGSDGYKALVDPELLGSPEVPDHLLALHGDLVDLGGPLVPLPPRVADVDLPHEVLIHHGSEDPHQGLPGYVGVVHDASRLGRSSLDYLEDLQIDLQPRSSLHDLINSEGFTIYNENLMKHSIILHVCFVNLQV